MPISKIKAGGINDDAVTTAKIVDGTVAAVDIADGAVTSAKLDTNIDIAGTLDVTGVLTADAAGSIAGDLGVGTTSPGQKLEVNSGNSTIGMRIRRFSGSYYSDIVQTDSPEGLAFKVGDGSSVTERLRILGTGGITFNGDTAAANALDDYEEGTWTPVYTGSSGSATYSLQDGTYTKVGRVVNFNGRLQAGNNTLSGNVDITGLPFSGDEDGAGICIAFSRGFTGLTTSNELKGYVTGTRIELRTQHTSSSSSAGLDANEMSATTTDNYIYFSGSYHTTS